MYQPAHHKEERLDVLHALIRQHPLGMMISVGPEDEPEANPVPLLLDETRGEKGILKGHLARANGQWKMLAERPKVLVVFQGAQSYITPSWYETKRETGKVVPTWNYAMVQVKGRAIVHDDRQWLAEQVRELTRMHEGDRAMPWAVEDAPESYIDVMLRGIVGIEIEITAIEGKWKVSQNRPEADRNGVIAGLGDERHLQANPMAELVREYSAFGPK